MAQDRGGRVLGRDEVRAAAEAAGAWAAPDQVLDPVGCASVRAVATPFRTRRGAHATIFPALSVARRWSEDSLDGENTGEDGSLFPPIWTLSCPAS